MLDDSILHELNDAIEAEVQRRSDELRRALLNSVSHELRTPLASIVASAGSLRQSDVEWSEGEQAEFAQAIEDEALRLNRLVGDLLDLSRIESGTLRPEKGWYDVGALIDDVVGRLRSSSDRQVDVAVQDDLPPVSLDYVEIDRVLTNLIEHAIGRAPNGNAIAVRACIEGEALRIDVIDSGPVVEDAVLARLFEVFARPDAVGFGLAVARGLVEAHGGQIWAANRAEHGLQVSFTLPL